MVTLPDGRYDLLLTERLISNLDLERADVAALGGERFELLLDVLTRQLSNALEDAEVTGFASAARQVEIVNALLGLLRQRQQAARPGATDLVDLIATPPQVLRSIQRGRQFPEAPGGALAFHRG